MFKYIKNFFNTNISFLIILLIIVFSLYGKSIKFEQTNLDDTDLITNNINFISDYKNIPKLFLMSPYYDHSTSYYRPILSLSFAVEAFFFRDNLKVYHLTNIILFVLSIYIFYLFCVLLKLNPNISKIVLLLIAVHPMFSSIVVWIPGRNDSLLTIFFFLSFICFIKYINTQKIKYAFLFSICFILSLFTKETFVALILLYFVYLFLYEYNVSKKKIFLLFVSLIPFIIVFFILRKLSVVTFGYEHYFPKINTILVNFIKYSFIYLYNFFVPEYIPIMLFNADLNIKIVLYNGLFLAIFIFLLCKKIVSKKLVVFSLLLFLLSLMPSFLQEEIVFLNHRFFICSIGFVIILVNVLDYLIIKIDKVKNLLYIFFIIFFISFFYVSFKQADKYEDYETFWINAYLDCPKYFVTCQNLSHIYMKRGMFEEAKYYAEKSIEIRSCYANLIDYAKLLTFIGKEEYLEQGERALLMLLEDIKVKKDLVCCPLSEIYYRKKDYEKALYYALMAYNIRKHDIGYCEQLIKIYDIMGKYEEELKIYEYLASCDKSNKIYKDKIEELKQKTINIGITNA